MERDFGKRVSAFSAVGFQGWNAFFKIASVRACVRPSVRPSVQKPIALKSVDFTSPKMVGSKKRHIPFWTPFLPYNQSILRREKGS